MSMLEVQIILSYLALGVMVHILLVPCVYAVAVGSTIIKIYGVAGGLLVCWMFQSTFSAMTPERVANYIEMKMEEEEEKEKKREEKEEGGGEEKEEGEEEEEKEEEEGKEI